MANMTIDMELLGKPKQKHWITYIKQRIRRNKNFLGFISGPTGSGKSWSTLSICQDLDPEFDTNRIVFNGLELMNLINSGKLKTGSAICFEEVGVEMNNKNWQSVTNKMLNFLMQTFRHRRFILIMNSPYMDFVDSSTRKLFHAEMQTVGINLKTKECMLKPQLIQYNGRYRKFYFKYLRVITRQGSLPVEIWNVKKPSQELIESYEVKKREYTDKLNKRIYDELQGLQKKQGGGTPELTDIQHETLELLKEGKTVEDIASIRGRNRAVIRKSMELLRKKGYKMLPVREGVRVIRYDIQEP